jgi:hypothetical protein
MKMQQFWAYFATSFPNSRKEFKRIKRAKNIKAYEQAVRELLSKENNQ